MQHVEQISPLVPGSSVDRLRLKVKPARGLLAKIMKMLSAHHVGIIKLDYGPLSKKEHSLEMDVSGLGSSTSKMEKDIRRLPHVHHLKVIRQG